MKPRVYFELGKEKGSGSGASSDNTNIYRRNLLKMFLVGGGGFLLGKFSDPLMHFVQGDKIISTRDFEDFRFVETGTELRVLDQNGEEIMIIDKDSLSI